MEYSGAVGKLIHEKSQKQKISWHCPFNLWSNHSFATSVYLFVGVCKAMLKTLTIARQDVGLRYRMSNVRENLFNALI
jgi:hypothetical protein